MYKIKAMQLKGKRGLRLGPRGCKPHVDAWAGARILGLFPPRGLPEFRLQTQSECLNSNFSAPQPEPHKPESGDPASCGYLAAVQTYPVRLSVLMHHCRRIPGKEMWPWRPVLALLPLTPGMGNLLCAYISRKLLLPPYHQLTSILYFNHMNSLSSSLYFSRMQGFS